MRPIDEVAATAKRYSQRIATSLFSAETREMALRAHRHSQPHSANTAGHLTGDGPRPFDPTALQNWSGSVTPAARQRVPACVVVIADIDLESRDDMATIVSDSCLQ